MALGATGWTFKAQKLMGLIYLNHLNQLALHKNSLNQEVYKTRRKPAREQGRIFVRLETPLLTRGFLPFYAKRLI